MERVAEPELMQQAEQVKAYAQADFSEPHNLFVHAVLQNFDEFTNPEQYKGTLLDLGCGSGDICRRMLAQLPRAYMHGVDGSAAMLQWAEKLSETAGCGQRLLWLYGRLTEIQYPQPRYDAVISNSLLHHLLDPQDLWLTIQQRTAPGAPIFIMDLTRPDDEAQAKTLVQTYAADEPQILQHDFYHSLLAAYTVEEVQQQLEIAQLQHLQVQTCSDRHLCIKGRMLLD
ncbi:MAG: class I SAM-dependent methyltransferase [Gammaproteobacteria bacterium]|nr:class I SAM-dependent methyltransferase [Gammaproteobacteria bacterium]MDH5803267.1 class I SAM-dependent methyltransferase [Gammaproteobacteria bacterium]